MNILSRCKILFVFLFLALPHSVPCAGAGASPETEEEGERQAGMMRELREEGEVEAYNQVLAALETAKRRRNAISGLQAEIQRLEAEQRKSQKNYAEQVKTYGTTAAQAAQLLAAHNKKIETLEGRIKESERLKLEEAEQLMKDARTMQQLTISAGERMGRIWKDQLIRTFKGMDKVIFDIQRTVGWDEKTLQRFDQLAEQMEGVAKATEQIGKSIEQAAKERAAAERKKAMGPLFAAREYTTLARSLLLNPVNWAKIAGLVGAVVVARHTAKKSVEYFQSILIRPTLVKETSKVSWYDRLRGAKVPLSRDISEMVMPPKLLSKIRKIAEQFKVIMQTGDELKNILLYGPPGTGKTMYATILARMSGLHYAIIHAPDIFKFAENNSVKQALNEIDKLFAWAEKSDKPVLLFFDELDAILPRRKAAFSGPQRLIVNKLLGMIEKPSNPKWALIGTTNMPGDLDLAALSRMGEQIEFGYPGFPERVELLKKYMKKEVVGAGIKVAKEVVTRYIDEYATMLKNFVGRDIEELAKEFRREAKFQKAKVLTDKIARPVVVDKVEQKRKQTIEMPVYDMGAAAAAA